MSTELKIKTKHLSEEARIIRFEEKKFLEQFRNELKHAKETGQNDIYPSKFHSFRQFESLHLHRTVDVRNENRSTFLARAFLEGRTYSSTERKVKDRDFFNCYILPRVRKMVEKYSNLTKEEAHEQLNEWLKT